MPLLAPDGRRIGSLVVFEDGLAEASLSHLQAIGEHLSKELQRKLYVFGWPLSGALNSNGLPVLEKVMRLDLDGDARRAAKAREIASSPGRRLLRRLTTSRPHSVEHAARELSGEAAVRRRHRRRVAAREVLARRVCGVRDLDRARAGCDCGSGEIQRSERGGLG